MKKILAFMTMAVLTASCIYPFNPEVTGEVDRLVVEGDIIVGSTFTISLNRVSSLDTPDAEMAENRPVGYCWVENESGKVYGRKSDRLGRYMYSDFTFDLTGASPDDAYRLGVCVNNKTYYTEACSPLEAPAITDLKYTVDDDNVAIELSMTSDSPYFTWKTREDWEIETQYTPEVMYVYGSSNADMMMKIGMRGLYGQYTTVDPENYMYKYCWVKKESTDILITSTAELSEDAVRDMEIVSFARDDERISCLYAINVEAQALSQGKYEYLHNLSVISNDTGGLFSPVPSDMDGNLVCKADDAIKVLGYVDVVKAPVSKRIFIKPDGIYKKSYIDIDKVKEIPTLMEVDASGEKVTYYYLDDYYSKSLRPYAMANGQQAYWVPGRCVDCTVDGATKDKPSFWPNDHK